MSPPQYQRHDPKGEQAPSLPPAHLAKTHPLGRDGHSLNRSGVLEEDWGQFWILGSPSLSCPGGLRSGVGPEEGLGEDRTGWCHTHLEDLHLLQHELLHLLVILGQHNDLLHCPAVWNGPGRASVGLRMLGKGHQPQPLPPPGPKPQRAVEQQLCAKVGVPPMTGRGLRGLAQDKGCRARALSCHPRPPFGHCSEQDAGGSSPSGRPLELRCVHFLACTREHVCQYLDPHNLQVPVICPFSCPYMGPQAPSVPVLPALGAEDGVCTPLVSIILATGRPQRIKVAEMTSTSLDQQPLAVQVPAPSTQRAPRGRGREQQWVPVPRKSTS